MRIVTRPDFDGVVCAVLLCEAETITEPIKWVEPGEIQQGLVEVRSQDIIANLPHHDQCAKWFDHHYTNRIDKPFQGAFEVAPSAARIIYEYYGSKFKRNYEELVKAADRIDSAELTLDEVLNPENYDDVLLSMTINNQDEPDEPYWNKLVELLRGGDIASAMKQPEVKRRCEKVVEVNKLYQELLRSHTRVCKQVAVTDFRPLHRVPAGNRFLVYSLFPEAHVQVRIRRDPQEEGKVVVNIGHSIFNRKCRVNVGLLLTRFDGGGHPGAGSCRLPADRAGEILPRIIDTLIKNEPIED